MVENHSDELLHDKIVWTFIKSKGFIVLMLEKLINSGVCLVGFHSLFGC